MKKLFSIFEFSAFVIIILAISSCSVMNTRFMITVCSEDNTPPLSEIYEVNIKHHEDYGLILTITDEGVRLHCNNLISR